MHTIFLSEPVVFRSPNLAAATDGEQDVDTEVELLARFSKQHGNVNFDRLPSCPLCLEKLDSAVTGLH